MLQLWAFVTWCQMWPVFVQMLRLVWCRRLLFLKRWVFSVVSLQLNHISLPCSVTLFCCPGDVDLSDNRSPLYRDRKFKTVPWAWVHFCNWWCQIAGKYVEWLVKLRREMCHFSLLSWHSRRPQGLTSLICATLLLMFRSARCKAHAVMIWPPVTLPKKKLNFPVVFHIANLFCLLFTATKADSFALYFLGECNNVSVTSRWHPSNPFPPQSVSDQSDS